MSTSGSTAGHPTSMSSGPRGILLREQDNTMMPMSGIPAGAPPPPPPLPPHATSGYQTPYGHMPPPPHPPPPSLPHPSTSVPLAPPPSMPPHMPPPPMHAAPPPPHGSFMPGANATSRRPPSLPTHDVQDQGVNGNGTTKRAPVEFNHAIDFVNKIKVNHKYTYGWTCIDEYHIESICQ